MPWFAVLDVEITGLSAASHRMIEVGVVTADTYGQISWSGGRSGHQRQDAHP